MRRSTPTSRGRIKIRFFWDWRQDATADNSEWVRVVQPWAGNQWGGQFIPRVDTEVAVAFMDADPDRPVVIGGLYNGNDKPIFPVAEKTKLGFRTRSVTKGGTDAFNELTFDDKKGNEECFFLHAQKDMRTEVENDQTLTVENDRTVTINKGDETVTLKQGDQSTELKLGNISVKCDLGSITMEAMQSITLKVGPNSIKIDQTGITVTGTMIKIDGQVLTEVKGLMTQVQGTAMLQLGGGIISIGLRVFPMAVPPAAKPANKLRNDLARVLPHLQLDEHGRSTLADCQGSIEALDRLQKAGLLIEATRLIAHALPPREAVWWACACSRHTAASGTNSSTEAQVRDAAEEWVRKPHRRAPSQCDEAGRGGRFRQRRGVGRRRRLLERRFHGPTGGHRRCRRSLISQDSLSQVRSPWLPLAVPRHGAKLGFSVFSAQPMTSWPAEQDASRRRRTDGDASRALG